MGLAIGSQNSNRVKIQIKDPRDGSVVATIGYTKSSAAQSKKKKKLPYNFKQISTQLMSAKTADGARAAASRARMKIAQLEKYRRNSDYDSEDVDSAIIHAQKMERIAKKRMRHLKQEESIKKNGDAASAENPESEEMLQEAMDMEKLLSMSQEELKALMDELEEAMKELEQTSPNQTTPDSLTRMKEEEMEVSDFDQLKKKHRSEELREIMEADMRYLRALFNKLAKEKQCIANGSSSTGNNNLDYGVSLEIAGADVPVASVELPPPVEGGEMDVSV